MDINTIIEYEQGILSDDDTVSLFQELIDTGAVWRLQGSYGRMAAALIEVGLCSAPDFDPHFDAGIPPGYEDGPGMSEHDWRL